MPPSPRPVAVLLAALALGLAGAAAAEPPVAGPSSLAPAPPAPSAPPGLTLAELGWPADTLSVEIRATVHVRREPRRGAAPAGKITQGTRAGWRRVIAAADRRCPRWIELEPQGWLCLDKVVPRADPPAASALPTVTGRALVPGTYFDVGADGTVAYATADDVRDGLIAAELGTLVMLRSRGEVEVDGVAYQRTNKGLVPSGDLRPLAPSSWAGIDLRATAPPSWPFAFAFTGRPWADVRVRAAPEPRADVIATRAPRTLVAFGAEQAGHVEIEPGAWVARTELRRVAVTAPPPGVGVDEPWIDVDLDEQVLVAYRGTTPQLATLISTGRVRGTTPVGTYRIRAMAATTPMRAEPTERGQYDVGEVPWAIRFRKGLFLHAAYWHDRFGAKQSHGCVNLAPRDARFLYEWVGLVPDGWSELELERGRGYVVRIRDAAHPQPPFYRYTDERTP